MKRWLYQATLTQPEIAVTGEQSMPRQGCRDFIQDEILGVVGVIRLQDMLDELGVIDMVDGPGKQPPLAQVTTLVRELH